MWRMNWCVVGKEEVKIEAPETDRRLVIWWWSWWWWEV